MHGNDIISGFAAFLCLKIENLAAFDKTNSIDLFLQYFKLFSALFYLLPISDLGLNEKRTVMSLILH